MRAQLRDGKVCGRCNGTGMRVFKIGNYFYSLPCYEAATTSLPMDEAEDQGSVKMKTKNSHLAAPAATD